MERTRRSLTINSEIKVTVEMQKYLNLANRIHGIAEELENTDDHVEATLAKVKIISAARDLISFTADITDKITRNEVPSSYIPLLSYLTDTWRKVYINSEAKAAELEQQERRSTTFQRVEMRAYV